MIECKQNLSRQLIAIVIVIFILISIGLRILLPKVLLPIYEKNTYTFLKQPLDLINSDVSNAEFNSDLAYLYITNDGLIISSTNLNKIIKLSPEKILKKINKEQGKFSYLGHTYYYYTNGDKYVTKIALTNDKYIKKIKSDILYTIFPVLMFTLLLALGLILLWSRQLIKK